MVDTDICCTVDGSLNSPTFNVAILSDLNINDSDIDIDVDTENEMPLDLLSLPDDVLLMIMSFCDNERLLNLRGANSRFNNLLCTYPRQICDQIIRAHFPDPFIGHYFQELTDFELCYWNLQSRFDGYDYHIRQLKRFGAIEGYLEAVEEILHFLTTKPPKIPGQHFSIKGLPRPNSGTKRWVLIYFTMLYHHNTLDLSFLQLHRHWPQYVLTPTSEGGLRTNTIPYIYSQQWEDAVDWVERVLMAKIWRTVSSADVNSSLWNSPSEIFPLLRTFVRHTHPEELKAVVSSCYSLEWTGRLDKQVLTDFRMRMLPFGDVCETWTRLYKGTIHDKNIV
ncbi:hypothetical protein TWF106_009634 [Orbilia oligospora]|uniref:F-box domain-containing protein n=1 Tax=Orbilia oligospora TaxID=2813651 RepID=A0A6G1MAE6_ORBOL|nr:hypothetical protein TWF788_006159 [Orbilia oligospora]KAF3207457.1 hypothetical protein TWF191_001034 [Orbilia oligospora]KAF3213057.1 hypothetical protein TWF106_009634 [Orbilia oligospora]KAF3251375.1 hypothetical protein TWF192_004871 [Orbilia oligospora]